MYNKHVEYSSCYITFPGESYFLSFCGTFHIVKKKKKLTLAHEKMLKGCLRRFWLQVNNEYNEACDKIFGMNNNCHMTEALMPSADTFSCQTSEEPPAFLQSFSLIFP